MIDSLFLFSVKKKKEIIWTFTFFYAAIIIVLISGWFGETNTHLYSILKEIGDKAGEAAVIFFFAAITPGIMRRFGIVSKWAQLLMLFRRQIGISVFYLVLLHLSFVRLFSGIIYGGFFPLSLFEVIGLVAFILLSLLFMTSNDWAVHHLGPWWARLHRLIYLISWIIFFHLIFQERFAWSIMIGFFAVLETASLIKYYFFSKTPTPSNV